MSGSVASTSSFGERVRILLEVQFVFLFGLLAFGPMIAVLCYASWAGGLDRAFDIIVMALFAPMLLFPIAFVFGVLPAVIAGLSLGIRQAFFGPAPWVVPLLLSAINGLMVWSFARLLTRGEFLDVPSLWGEAPSLSILSFSMGSGAFAATLICWRFTKGWHIERRANLGQSA